MSVRRKNSKEKGVAMLVTFALLSLVMVAATSYIDQSTQAVRLARMSNHEARGTWLCESGVQDLVGSEWKVYKIAQNFAAMDAKFTGATIGTPKGGVTGTSTDVGKYAAAVVDYKKKGNLWRTLTIRAVGFIDGNGNNVADAGEPRKTVDATVTFSLKRSQVFDYAQFVNNYGWMKGFDQWSMVINGDWRVNGDFDFLSGTATVNGSVIAAANNKLTPGALGLVNKTPYKWNQATYNGQSAWGGWASRMRQPYDPAKHGAFGTPEFEKWRDLVHVSEAEIVNDRPFGATIQDSSGVRAWKRESPWAQYKTIDTDPTEEIVMPDLSDFGNVGDSADANGKQFAKSKAYKNPKSNFADGTVNPNAGQEAYVEVWDSATSAYVRVSSNGVVNGSTLLIGDSSHPVKIHGPVTVNGDVAIGGYVQGQGTLYSARNINVISSVKYVNPPDFRGANPDLIDKANEKKDFLGMAARGSVMIGDLTKYGAYELDHMKPPFTKARVDEYGNPVPAFNATAIDSWGIAAYKTLIESDPAMWAALKAEATKGVNQIDGIVYTNNTIGGMVGYEGGGLTINGSMVCKDLAIAAYTSPITMNYDNRIHDRGDGTEPLIDLDLPKGPTVTFTAWLDKGFRVD